jgi:hypothetical protein
MSKHRYRIIFVAVREDKQGEGLILTANDDGVHFTAPNDATFGYLFGKFTKREFMKSLRVRFRRISK